MPVQGCITLPGRRKTAGSRDFDFGPDQTLVHSAAKDRSEPSMAFELGSQIGTFGPLPTSTEPSCAAVQLPQTSHSSILRHFEGGHGCTADL